MQNFKGYFDEFSNIEKVAILPGGFKPPTAGHFKALSYLLQETDRGIVFIGSKDRELITPEMSKRIWQVYSKYLPKPIDIRISAITPVKDTYDFADQNSQKIIVVGAGGKDEDIKRYSYFNKNIERYPLVKVVKIPIMAGGISGTKTRELLQKNVNEAIKYFTPKELSEDDRQAVKSIISSK